MCDVDNKDQIIKCAYFSDVRFDENEIEATISIDDNAESNESYYEDDELEYHYGDLGDEGFYDYLVDNYIPEIDK